ncbi:hypothetical protein RJP21_10365 [Paenibacillus sp. VCA1]|uniref:hypothetical protein n=1 Tax=Paenibacillus sp. VCA1 TaxID=3039148 RepID=UPI0028715FC1|nr:hypothetical protein [Paenibacillus sp. VCA1]MDR9854004.1 hypothetical protein [Paenibacillus sp. VCA1]
MALTLFGIFVFAYGLFAILRPNARWFGGFGDPYATTKRLKFTRIRGILSIILGALFILEVILNRH